MLDHYHATKASGSKQTEAGSDSGSAAASVAPDKPESTVPQDASLHRFDNTDSGAPPKPSLQEQVVIKSEYEMEPQASIQRPITPDVIELDARYVFLLVEPGAGLTSYVVVKLQPNQQLVKSMTIQVISPGSL